MTLEKCNYLRNEKNIFYSDIVTIKQKFQRQRRNSRRQSVEDLEADVAGDAREDEDVRKERRRVLAALRQTQQRPALLVHVSTLSVPSLPRF